MRFVAIFLPPSGAQGKPNTTSPAGFPKRVRSISPMSRTIDGLDSPVLDSPVLDSPVSPLISDDTPLFTKIPLLPSSSRRSRLGRQPHWP